MTHGLWVLGASDDLAWARFRLCHGVIVALLVRHFLDADGHLLLVSQRLVLVRIDHGSVLDHS